MSGNPAACSSIPVKKPQTSRSTKSALSRFAALRIILIAALCSFLASCATEAPPRPPRVERPVKVNNLAVEQVGRTLALSFTIPVRATDGKGLTKPIEIEIFRQVTPPGQAPPTAIGAAKPWVHFGAQEVSRLAQGPEFVYKERLAGASFAASVGSVVSFAVVTLTRGFGGRPRESEPSNVARTMLLNVPSPVESPSVRQLPSALELQWRAPGESPGGSPLPTLTGYRVYRGEKLGLFAFVAETRSTRYLDPHFQFGQTYHYRVRAVFAEDGYTAETADSSVAEVTPHDIFPPPPPEGLTAVYTGKAVQLIWKPDPDPDLAGYNVYRRQAGGPARRMNPQLLPTPVFQDVEIRRGTEYEYWVTALDRAHNESQPSAPFTTSTR